MFEDPDLRAGRIQLQPPGNALVRLMVRRTFVPLLVAEKVSPVGQQPDFVRLITWAHHIQPYETRRALHLVRAIEERLLHLGRHSVRNFKLAENQYHPSGPYSLVK
jgi:hypothetical protein